jgi:hypothetical protein
MSLNDKSKKDLEKITDNQSKQNQINKILAGEKYILKYEIKPRFVKNLETIKE